jgi:hypothetical protein
MILSCRAVPFFVLSGLLGTVVFLHGVERLTWRIVGGSPLIVLGVVWLTPKYLDIHWQAWRLSGMLFAARDESTVQAEHG